MKIRKYYTDPDDIHVYFFPRNRVKQCVRLIKGKLKPFRRSLTHINKTHPLHSFDPPTACYHSPEADVISGFFLPVFICGVLAY